MTISTPSDHKQTAPLADQQGTPAVPSPKHSLVGLLRLHPYFARVWWSQMFSQIGNWFTYVALLALILELTGNGLHVSFVILSGALPAVLLGPLVGSVADRCDRRWVLIASDVVCALVSLGYLVIHEADQVWIAYVLLVVRSVANSFFSPAINAAVPQFVSEDRLTQANSLLSITNGVMMAVSAWLGGMVAMYMGREVCFVLDSATFLISAAALFSIPVPFSAATSGGNEKSVFAWCSDIASGFSYLGRHRYLLSLIVYKALAGLGGGLMVLMSVIPVQVFHAGDYGVGLFYGSRGLGTIAGAFLAGSLATWSLGQRTKAIKYSLLLTGLFSLAAGFAWGLYAAAACVFGAFLAVGVQWVLTPSLLQQVGDDAYLGRLFALDNLGLSLTAALTALLSGLALQRWEPCWVAWGLGATLVLATALVSCFFRVAPPEE